MSVFESEPEALDWPLEKALARVDDETIPGSVIIPARIWRRIKDEILKPDDQKSRA